MPLRLLREREGGLAVARVEGERGPPVLDRFRQVALPALGEGEQALDRAALRCELGRFGDLLQAGIDLLLPQERQAEVRPARGLVGHEHGHPVKLLAGQDLLARLQGRECRVERRHRLAVGGLGHLDLAAARGAGEHGQHEEA